MSVREGEERDVLHMIVQPSTSPVGALCTPEDGTC